MTHTRRVVEKRGSKSVLAWGNVLALVLVNRPMRSCDKGLHSSNHDDKYSEIALHTTTHSHDDPLEPAPFSMTDAAMAALRFSAPRSNSPSHRPTSQPTNHGRGSTPPGGGSQGLVYHDA
ncbi:hypothetical protein XANCAGTX0491_004693 [Xanthoria calcicola]